MKTQRGSRSAFFKAAHVLEGIKCAGILRSGHFLENAAFSKDAQCEVPKMGGFGHLREMIGHLW